MRVIVLGGAGQMGSRAVEDLCEQGDVELVTIADRDRGAVERLRAQCAGGRTRVGTVEIDARDHAGLVKALRGHDVVASALGPFFEYEERLVRAAIEAGVDYCSICDEWEPAEAVLDRFDDAARERGVTIVPCLGASPGLTNLIVAQVAGGLDCVERARVAVYLPLTSGAGAAALRHGLYIMSGQVARWRGGKRELIAACSAGERVEFPAVGLQKTWAMGHAEPVTLPRAISGLQDVDFLMGFGPGSSAIAGLARLGVFANPRRADALARLLSALEDRLIGAGPGLGAVRIDVWGQRAEQSVHELRCGTGLMRDITGLNLAVGALMIGRKILRSSEGGAYPPEACFDAAAFLESLERRGIRSYQDIAMTRPAPAT